jgi:hypothetical protein
MGKHNEIYLLLYGKIRIKNWNIGPMIPLKNFP